ncbi:MAG: transposase [Deltaproteobacteria bacterium]|nr:transposase [Deltaproteobacteria bacterium]
MKELDKLKRTVPFPCFPCPELIITDGGKGLHSALEYVYPKILKQRCWAHKTRNILDEDRLWSKIRTTNAIERAFREVRRRTRPIGVFTNRESVERIVFAVFHYLNVNWENNPLNEFTHKN